MERYEGQPEWLMEIADKRIRGSSAAALRAN